MKKECTQTRFHHLMVLCLLLLGSSLFMANLNAQTPTISILSEPAGPLYVGDTIEVDYSATSFSPGTVFYLEFANDTIIASNSAVTGTFTAVVPEGYSSPASLSVLGVQGTINGQVEIRPTPDDLSLAGESSFTDYGGGAYAYYFSLPGIRRMQLPEMDLAADSAEINFYYSYSTFPDTLELVLEYSVNGGASFTDLDTINYVTTGWINETIGIPQAARTANTILRFRQLYSNIENSSNYTFNLYTPIVTVGDFPVQEGSQVLTGSPFTVALPSTNITSISAPVTAPYNGNVYLGDSIYIQASTNGFTADTKFEIVFNASGNINDPVHHLRNIVAQETSPGLWNFEARLPTSMEFNTNNTFWLVPYKGSSYEHGTSISYDFTASGPGNHTIIGEQSINGTYGIYFTAENVREMETEELIISDEGSITFNLSRRSDVFSPDITELVADFTTDGGSTYTELGRISLNQMAVYTSGTTAFEFALPAGAVSQNTSFRLRQNAINSQTLDQFYLHSYSILLNSNRFTESVNANYESNTGIEFVYTPIINFLPVEVPQSLFYPGTAMNLSYQLTVGEFPASDNIQAVITTVSPNIYMGSDLVSDVGTISTVTPAVLGGIYTLQLQVLNSQGTYNSNSRSITIEEVELELLSVSGTPARDVDGTPYYYVGDDITVDYKITGNAPYGVQLQIENSIGDYVTIGTDLPVDEQLTATIPTDIALATSPRIRLALSDSLYNAGSWKTLFSTYGEYGFPDNPNDSMIESAVGLVDSDVFSTYSNYATFGQAGTRSFQTLPFELVNKGNLYVSIYLMDNYNNYNWEKKVEKVAPIYIQYSTDNGSTWENIDVIDPLDYSNSVDYVNQTFSLPFDAISSQTVFRVIQNEDNTLAFGENVWMINQIYVQTSLDAEIISGTMNLNLQLAAISLGQLAKTTFGPGEAITIPYNVVGNFAADVGFAAFLEDYNNDLHLIETSDATGLVQLATNLPVNLPETSGNVNSYDLIIMPYQKTVAVTEPVIGYMEDFDDDDEDVIFYEGGSRESWGYDLTENGRRSVLTKALTQLSGDSVFFEFNIWLYENLFPSEGIVVEVTYDGGTSYSALDTISSTGLHTVALATADMNAQTHLRWIQNVNFGANQNGWQLKTMTYKSDESNIITSGYLSLNQPAVIEIDYPNLPSQFTINSQEDVIYSGETFDLELSIPEGMPQLPASSEYTFYLGDNANNVVIDVNGDSIVLGSMTGTGTANLAIPATVFKNTYRILATVQIDDPDNVDPFVYYDEVNILSLDIYNPLLKTLALTDEAFRGDDITVDWELQTGTVNTADYYFHLKVGNQIIYTRKDAPAGSFVQPLPTDISTGNQTVSILVTTDSIYSEGDATTLDQFNNDEWVDQGNMYIVDYDYVRFNQIAEANRVVSNSFDMSSGGMVSFVFTYDETVNSWLDSYKVKFEYSLDGGETYVQIDEYPNAEFVMGDESATMTYYFGKGQLNESTIFRFRRLNGNYGYAYVEDFVLTQWSNEAPIDIVSDQISILNQSVELGTIPTSLCPGASINLDYTINGAFGEKVSHQLQYNVNGGSYQWFPDFEEIGLTSGSGSFDVKIPENFAGGDYKFRLYSSDATTDNTFSLYSLPTEDEMYLIPAINFTGTTLSGDETLCAADTRKFYLYNTQPYFVYQARNVATGALYGDPVSSENGGTQTLFTETIDADVELEIVVQATSKDGTINCSTGVLTDKISYTLVPQRDLYMMDDYASVWTSSDDAYTICENNPLDLTFEVGYYDKDGAYVSSGLTSILWYRDDLNNAVASTNQLATFNQSGDYFAEVLVDGCKYSTSSVAITVLPVPDKPTVSASGELVFCEGESVELSADMQYPYYQWYGGSSGTALLSGSSQIMEVVTDGTYRLRVSDYPLDAGCLSPLSDPVQVTVIDNPETYLQHISGGTYISEGKYVSCGDEVILRVQNEPSTFSWTLDGEVFASSWDNDEIRATKTGYYNVETVISEKGVTCVFTTPDSILVQIADEVPRPTITLTGDDKFCSGEGSAILSAPEGYDGYIWTFGEGPLTPVREITDNSISAVESGSYSVSVVDSMGCESDYAKDVEITIIPLPAKNSNVWAEDYTLCGPGVAEIFIDAGSYYNERLLTYQLVDVLTGQLVGDPASKTVTDDSNFIVLRTDTVYSEREFAIMVYDQSATGCEIILDETVVIDVNLAEIEVIGNVLTASYGAQEYQWYRNDDPIVGSRGTSRSITVFDDAEYTVRLIYSFDCTLSSDNGGVKNLTGIDLMLSDENIEVYPNPVQNHLMIDFANDYYGEITVEITNIAGQTIYNQIVDKHDQFMNLRIETESLNEGVYFINFITDKQSLVKSIVKQ